MDKPRTQLLGPYALELLRTLCGYVLQQEGMDPAARHASEVLSRLAGGVPAEERQPDVAAALLRTALADAQTAAEDWLARRGEA